MPAHGLPPMRSGSRRTSRSAACPRAARDEAGWLRITNLPQIERFYGQIAGDAAIAELGRRFVAAAGDAELSSPQRGVFRVFPRERAQVLAATCANPSITKA